MSRPVVAFLLGLVGVLAVTVCHLAGFDRRAELHALDLRLLHASGAVGIGDIVHVDIDDGSLAELGRWPWPRERIAGIIDVLSECDARTVALDVIMPDPQKVRYVSAAGEIYGGDESAFLAEAPPVPVFDDGILADSIRRAARVFLPMHIDFVRVRKPALQRRLEEILRSDPTLKAAQIARRLGLPTHEVEAALPRALKNTIDGRVREILSRDREAPLSAVLKAVLPNLAAHRASQERDMVEKAYLRHRAIGATERFSIADARAGSLPVRSGRMVPPLVTLAQAAAGCGFVTVEPDEDGVVRRIPLLGRSGGRLYPQFALALAGHELVRSTGGKCEISADSSSVIVRWADGLRKVIPVDNDGFMLIRWARGSWPGAGRKDAPRHIPAASVVAVWDEKRKLGRIDDLAYGLCVKFLKLGHALPDGEPEALYWKFLDQTEKLDKVYKERLDAERRALKNALYRPSKAPEAQRIAELRRKEHEIEIAVRASAKKLVDELRKPDRLDAFLGKPAEPAAAPATSKPASTGKPKAEPSRAGRQFVQEMQRFRALKARAAEILDLLEGLPAERRRIEASLEKLTRELRALVAGKICMVGSTSTGAADFVPTPLSKRTPGVVVNASIVNTILSGDFLRRPARAAGVLTILVAGAAVCLVAATCPVVQAAALSLFLALGYVAFNALVVFAGWRLWLVVVAPIAAMLAGFLLVTAYRQLTEERAKRRIRDMFAHALSPVLVDRLLEDPSLAALGGHNRTLSCFFSDLAGFTAFSERLGPRETVRVLNLYFDSVTEVIQGRWGGYLNKYLGDGIFAFFGAPVYQSDHPTRAVLAAVDCLREVERLNGVLAVEIADGVRLSMRIGITTGEAMVGNCGSSQRMDYTAIGECVNLASRLESANKFFGSHILVADGAWRLCERRNLLARPLGQVVIVGVREPVRIWEVRGDVDGAAADVRRAFADFTRAMELFVAREFAVAGKLFEDASELLGDDRPAQIYRHLCAELASATPDKDWQGKAVNSDGITRIVCSWDA